tara:strand:- start:10385 stop:10552 length:168 start_codon:yes stop_codon:yes gene_type:complete
MKKEFRLRGYVRVIPLVGVGLGVKKNYKSIDLCIIIPFLEIELSLILKNNRNEIN